MSFWFSDESMEEMSWAYGCSLAECKVSQEELDAKNLAADFENINESYHTILNSYDHSFQKFYLHFPENQEVKEKLSSLDCDVYTFNSKAVLVRKGATFEDIKNQVKETWGKAYFDMEIANGYLHVKSGRKTLSEIPQELADFYGITDYCLEVADKKLSIEGINKEIGKIYNIRVLYCYIQGYLEMHNRLLEKLFNLTPEQWNKIWEYSNKKALVSSCRYAPQSIDKFIAMLETKVAPVLDKLGADYIPFKPMLLNFKKKVLNGQIK